MIASSFDDQSAGVLLLIECLSVCFSRGEEDARLIGPMKNSLLLLNADDRRRRSEEYEQEDDDDDCSELNDRNSIGRAKRSTCSLIAYHNNNNDDKV